MTDFSTDVPEKTESALAPLYEPRLSIWHLMLWTLCSAVYLSVVRAQLVLQGGLPERLAAFQQVSSVVQSAVTGAVLAGAIILIHARFRGATVPSHPGHWLLLVKAAYLVFYFPLLLFLMLMSHYEIFQTHRLTYPFAVIGLSNLGSGLAYAVAVTRMPLLSWKLLFSGFVVTHLLESIYPIALFLGNLRLNSLAVVAHGSYLLLMAGTIVVSLIDWRKRNRRDWLHWLGVTIFVSGMAIWTVWMIALRWIR